MMNEKIKEFERTHSSHCTTGEKLCFYDIDIMEMYCWMTWSSVHLWLPLELFSLEPWPKLPKADLT